MSKLNCDVNALKKNYREIFMASVEEIKKHVEYLKPDGVEDIFDIYADNTDGAKWQKDVIAMFEDDIAKDIYKKWSEIQAYRLNFSCVGCATCCNLACSEFSPEQLKEKAAKGDKFANQFLSVFVPYESREEARKVYPEYIELLDETIDEPVYFYHCPKLNECKRCSDYENRPQICRDFPDNPLSILPKSCGYYNWKREVEPVALMLHSMLEIIEYYKENIPYKKEN